MFNASLEDADQRLEQGLRGLNDLAVGLIELLILKQVVAQDVGECVIAKHEL